MSGSSSECVGGLHSEVSTHFFGVPDQVGQIALVTGDKGEFVIDLLAP